MYEWRRADVSARRVVRDVGRRISAGGAMDCARPGRRGCARHYELVAVRLSSVGSLGWRFWRVVLTLPLVLSSVVKSK